MSRSRAWKSYHEDYRSTEMKQLAEWIAEGRSGAVVGMGGAGKSNLLGFLCHRPEVLERHMPSAAPDALAILVDLNSLPSLDLATLYRLLLRSFIEVKQQFSEDLRERLVEIFEQARATQDPFVAQTAVWEWLLELDEWDLQIALVIDRFDRFLGHADEDLMDSLRALRDRFKGRLSLIVGLREEIAYLADPGMLGELFEILDTQVCWVGPMREADSRRMIQEELGHLETELTPSEADLLLDLTGGYPALLKAACRWWHTEGHQAITSTWLDDLSSLPSVRFRIGEIWEGLTQAEQAALAGIAGFQSRSEDIRKRQVSSKVEKLIAKAQEDLESEHAKALQDLDQKSLVVRREHSWHIRGQLLEAHASKLGQPGRGALWLDGDTNEVYQGRRALTDLANLERKTLEFLLSRPRARVSKTDVIEAVWPDDAIEGGVMDDALYQVIRGLRTKIEPQPSKPRYLVTWRGRPEGGYQLFPEGRPMAKSMG